MVQVPVHRWDGRSWRSNLKEQLLTQNRSDAGGRAEELIPSTVNMMTSVSIRLWGREVFSLVSLSWQPAENTHPRIVSSPSTDSQWDIWPPPPSCRSSVRIYWTAMVSSPSSFNSVTLMTRLLIRHNEAAAVSRASMSETQPTVKQTDRCFIWRFYWQFIVTKGPQFNTVNQMCQNINIYFYVQVSDCILYWLYIVCTIH